MRWRGRRESDNIEDRRGAGGGFGFPFPRGGRRMRLPSGGRGMRQGGIGGIGLLVIVGVMLLFGINPLPLIQGIDPSTGPVGRPDIRLPEVQTPRSGTRRTGADDELKRFVAVVLADTEDVWHDIFAKYGKTYQEPKLVLFTGRTQSGCGTGVSAMGPFYCPLDRKVYVDLSFYRELRTRFKAPGDFAQAYVVAHEVGHHVQTLLGISEKVQRAKARASKREANAIQVRMELQADCLAGLWAHHTQRSKNVLEAGDIEEALNAASAIGDDTLQKRSQGYVVPDAFTHGTSKQRVRWFRQGYDNGKLRTCDTFNVPSL